MSRPTADVALVTDRRYTATAAAPGDWYLANILADDDLLRAALARHGVSSVRVDWSDDAIDWARFRCTVLRTPWDYYERPQDFAAWLGRVECLTRLCNPPATVRWNMDKHYLADLADAGVPVVPTRFIERGGVAGLAAVLERERWRAAVVKPCVSGAARHTYRFDDRDAAGVEAVVGPLLADEAFLVQPFQEAVPTHGEDSLMVFGGIVTHAVRKTPKPGDFRVQDDHGGTVAPCAPSDEQVALARRATSCLGQAPAYARVDMVRDDAGGWSIMELELIEPELWLRLHPPAADAFAAEIARFIGA